MLYQNFITLEKRKGVVRMKEKKRMSKLVLFFVVILTMLNIISPISKAEAKEKVYQIATDITFAPFEFQDVNGDFVGIDMDLMAAIAKDQGFKYEMKPLGFNAAVQALESKQVDAVIAGMSITDERQMKFDFSEPYFDSGIIMAVDSDNDKVSSYKDLKGQKVAVKTGTEGQALQKASKTNMVFPS